MLLCVQAADSCAGAVCPAESRNSTLESEIRLFARPLQVRRLLRQVPHVGGAHQVDDVFGVARAPQKLSLS
jgi:hypothetical protein